MGTSAPVRRASMDDPSLPTTHRNAGVKPRLTPGLGLDLRANLGAGSVRGCVPGAWRRGHVHRVGQARAAAVLERQRGVHGGTRGGGAPQAQRSQMLPVAPPRCVQSEQVLTRSHLHAKPDRSAISTPTRGGAGRHVGRRCRRSWPEALRHRPLCGRSRVWSGWRRSGGVAAASDDEGPPTVPVHLLLVSVLAHRPRGLASPRSPLADEAGVPLRASRRSAVGSRSAATAPAAWRRRSARLGEPSAGGARAPAGALSAAACARTPAARASHAPAHRVPDPHRPDSG